jgi:hypothetical protein
MTKASRFFGRSVLAFAICLSVPVVISTGTGNLLGDSRPDLAIAVNPFDTEARIRRLLSALEAPAGSSAPEAMRTEAGRIIAHAPVDARGYSLLGETYLRAGDRAAADRLFQTALRFSKAEILALQRSLILHGERGEFSAMLDRIDLIGRRWPERFARIAPHLAPILADPQAYGRAVDLLSSAPPWRGRLLRALSESEQGLEIAYRIETDLFRRKAGTRPQESAETMRALIRARRPDLAYRLFLLTQSEEDRRIAGYVFNGAFRAEPGPRPFDWRLTDNASAEIRWNGAGASGGRGVRIRFLGKPVRTVGISQHLRLPPGSYRMTVEFGASGLVIPRGLFLRLSCVEPRRDFARIPFPEGDRTDGTIGAEFEVPPEACGLMRLGMDTDLIAESFRYRYQGRLDLSAIRVERKS